MRATPTPTRAFRLNPRERVLLDLYCAEILAHGPGNLTLRKVSASFDPCCYDALSRRGYYVTYSQGREILYQHFRPSERRAAEACFQATAEALQRA
jgi:hypothetical protein